MQYHTGVNRFHHKGCSPAVKVRIKLRAGDALGANAVLMIAAAQEVGVTHFLAHFWIGFGRFKSFDHTRDSAARSAAFHGFHAQFCVGQWMTKLRLGALLHGKDTHVRGDRVKAAAVDYARAAGLCSLVVFVFHHARSSELHRSGRRSLCRFRRRL